MGVRHLPTTEALRVRAEVLYEGGRPLWDDFMAELAERHLGTAHVDTGRPPVAERLQAAYERAMGRHAAPAVL